MQLARQVSDHAASSSSLRSRSYLVKSPITQLPRQVSNHATFILLCISFIVSPIDSELVRESVSELASVGGARIRADMRLRSKQQRRVMNAEFSNGICLA